MLRVLLPHAGQVAPVPAGEPLPADALWIDMLMPDPAEEEDVESALGIDVPTRHEMKEIEPTSRLHERDGALFMTATIVGGADTGKPTGEPVTFILRGDRLVTVRYHDPQSFTTFGAAATRELASCRTGTATFLWLLDVIVDRLADILETVGSDLDRTSKELFRRPPEDSETLTSSFSDIVKRIGVSNDRTSKVHESLVSLKRVLGFFRLPADAKDREQLAMRLDSLKLDVTALTDHVSYLSANITFLLDASMGMIAIEQNGIIKIFSVMAVVFLPPTLVASIYGMNFDVMPELHWIFGYPFALVLMVLAAVCLCAGAAFAFIELVDDVLEGETHTVDRAILLALRTPGDVATPIGPAWVRIFFRDITALGGYPVVMLTALLAAGYLAMIRRWGSVLLLLSSLGGGAVLNSYLKVVFDRPRPDFVAHLVEVATASLPSGHATLSAVAYLTLGALLARTQPNRWLQLYIVSASIGLALLVGMSRVYLGVHYPTDVLAGWCLGAAWAVGCWLVAWLFSPVPAKVPEGTNDAG